MKGNRIILFVVVALLIVIDFLTFHDIFEPHTVKDWLLLAASIFAFIYFARFSFAKTR